MIDVGMIGSTELFRNHMKSRSSITYVYYVYSDIIYIIYIYIINHMLDLSSSILFLWGTVPYTPNQIPEAPIMSEWIRGSGLQMTDMIDLIIIVFLDSIQGWKAL